MLALIDYGSGNICSVTNALRREGADVELVSTPERLREADKVLLPGVGAFGDCVHGLQSRGLWDPLRAWLDSGKPFLGICVGYQMLFESSEESPGVAGFGFFKGAVKRFGSSELKVPQIGWNQLQIKREDCPLFRGIKSGSYAYFVHSFFPQPMDNSIVATETEYGETFASAIWRDNVYATQFHPEKSQGVGLQILRNFVALAT